jgi:hypothetical protein
MSISAYSVSGYRAFIDESGDEGFAFDRGGSEWFVLSAIVFENTDQNRLRLVSLLDETRDKINSVRQNKNYLPNKKPFHFSKLKHDERKYFARKIGQNDFIRTITILIHKPSLDAGIFKGKGQRLFLYTSRLLLERVSWCCRDWRGSEVESTVQITFSNKGGLKTEEIKNYLKNLQENSEKYEYRGSKNVDIDNIQLLSPGRAVGLQIADAVASSYFFAVQKNAYAMEEISYVQEIINLSYRSTNGQLFSYGIKVYPKEAESLLSNHFRRILADPGL